MINSYWQEFTQSAKNVLLLQGPVGPFFKRFAEHLEEQHSISVFKFNFNGGDRHYYPESTGKEFAYVDGVDGFSDCLADFIKKHEIDSIVCFGHHRIYHRLAKSLCMQDQERLSFWAFEEGYLRPHYITFEKWGDVYPDGFIIKHDNSNALVQQQHMVTQFMDWSKKDIVAGYDRRKFTLPLKSKKLEFVCSKEIKQVQIMDVVASGMAYLVSKKINSGKRDPLFIKLEEIGIEKLIGHNTIWPSPFVTPQELGTVYDGGTNPADATVTYLMS